jgi:hypothetical protein
MSFQMLINFIPSIFHLIPLQFDSIFNITFPTLVKDKKFISCCRKRTKADESHYHDNNLYYIIYIFKSLCYVLLI